jgi:hypothetical protein
MLKHPVHVEAMLKQAREKFRRAVDAAGGPEKAAHVLGCTRAYVDMIYKGPDDKGRKRPGPGVGEAIRRCFGIPYDEWIEAAVDEKGAA